VAPDALFSIWHFHGIFSNNARLTEVYFSSNKIMVFFVLVLRKNEVVWL